LPSWAAVGASNEEDSDRNSTVDTGCNMMNDFRLQIAMESEPADSDLRFLSTYIIFCPSLFSA
jgi:hypothetical protein